MLTCDQGCKHVSSVEQQLSYSMLRKYCSALASHKVMFV